MILMNIIIQHITRAQDYAKIFLLQKRKIFFRIPFVNSKICRYFAVERLRRRAAKTKR